MEPITPEHMNRASDRLQDRLHHYWDRAATGVMLLAVHETDALLGHWSEINERLALACHARSSSELVRDQFDLFPESLNRLARDQQVRRELLRGLIKDLSLH